MYQRVLDLGPQIQNSFFLWGPRQTGKTSLLKKKFSDALWIQLLHNEEFRRFSSQPELLRQIVAAQKPDWVVIDEVQKVPELLEEIHSLIESTQTKFVLCGSSARKLKSHRANMLGGRALRFELFGMSAIELGKDFSISQVLNKGYLPSIYVHQQPLKKLEAYCSDYLKEEVFNEGLLRSLPPFSKFLELAALSDTQEVSFSTFARDVGVSSPTIKAYFEILCDTLIGTFLPAYSHAKKRRVKKSPKFYFFDVGVVNFLAHRSEIVHGTPDWGMAFENWVFHELQCFLKYKNKNVEMSYWSLAAGKAEVDFILGKMDMAIEAKSSNKIHTDHLKGLREIVKDYPKLEKRIVVSTEAASRLTDDGILILTPNDFVERLWRGEII